MSAQFQRFVIGLGSNLGNRLATMKAATMSMSAHGALEAVSGVYETEPLGPPQPKFLNAAVCLATQLEPEQLLARLLDIERSFGRTREVRWGPRTIDLDILWSPGLCLETPSLTLPHPELTARAFALCPLLELFPEARDPVTGRAYREIVSSLPDPPIYPLDGTERGRWIP